MKTWSACIVFICYIVVYSPVHFLGISAISSIIIAMALSVSLCMCVRVFVCHFRYHRSYISENQKCKIDVCRFWHLPSNGVIAKILHVDLYLLFEDQIFFVTLIFLKLSELRQKFMEWLLTISIFATEVQHYENCTPWSWSTFWRSKIWNVNHLAAEFIYLSSSAECVEMTNQSTAVKRLVSLKRLELAQQFMGWLL